MITLRAPRREVLGRAVAGAEPPGGLDGHLHLQLLPRELLRDRSPTKTGISSPSTLMACSLDADLGPGSARRRSRGAAAPRAWRRPATSLMATISMPAPLSCAERRRALPTRPKPLTATRVGTAFLLVEFWARPYGGSRRGPSGAAAIRSRENRSDPPRSWLAGCPSRRCRWSARESVPAPDGPGSSPRTPRLRGRP